MKNTRRILQSERTELENRIGEVNNALREAHAKLETQRNEQKQKQQAVYDAKAKEAGGAAKYRRQLAVEQFGTTSEFERAGYILPDGQMLDFARKVNEYVPNVVLSVVDIMDKQEIEECRNIAQELGVKFRVRELITEEED